MLSQCDLLDPAVVPDSGLAFHIMIQLFSSCKDLRLCLTLSHFTLNRHGKLAAQSSSLICLPLDNLDHNYILLYIHFMNRS